GEADGVLGFRTREALIAFQRQQGIQTTGSIDTRTVTALGLSNRIGQQTGQSATQGRSSTVGQGQAGTQQGTGQANAPMPQNQSTTGQATSGAKQPSAQQGTSGQAAPQNQSTVGQGGNKQAPAQNSGQNSSSK